MQHLHTRLDVASKDTVEVNLLAASTNYLITQLYTSTTQPNYHLKYATDIQKNTNPQIKICGYLAIVMVIKC